MGHEGQGVVSGCPGGKQQGWLVIPVPHSGWGQRYALSAAELNLGFLNKLLNRDTVFISSHGSFPAYVHEI